MRILVIGGGAREHAIAWRLAASHRVTEVLCAPGNPGIASIARVLPIATADCEALLRAAREHKVDLAVVGPEAALEAGVVDLFEAGGVPIVGPLKAAALLESSKAFAKEIMGQSGVPTARYEVFTERAALERHCAAQGAPLVLKADGLASGKGVFVVHEEREFAAALDALFGPLRADKVVAEEFLTGVEVSCIFACNGIEAIPLAPAHDYKRLRDGDQGPNTGGMGAVCPSPRITETELAWIQERCAAPVLQAMSERGTPFRGFLYAGLMVPVAAADRPHGIRVLEYNTRLGDPECQAILPRLSSDPLELLEWMAGMRREKPRLQWRPETSACVVIASDGYPEAPKKGDLLEGLELATLVPGTALFHAATGRDSRGSLISAGGRTLSVVGFGTTCDEARERAYQAVDLIQLKGRRARRDIGL